MEHVQAVLTDIKSHQVGNVSRVNNSPETHSVPSFQALFAQNVHSVHSST